MTQLQKAFASLSLVAMLGTTAPAISSAAAANASTDAVLRTYADIAQAKYLDSLDIAKRLYAAERNLVTNLSPGNLQDPNPGT